MFHFAYTVLFAAITSAADALPGNRPAGERLRRGGYVFATSMAAVVAGGWAMFLIHR